MKLTTIQIVLYLIFIICILLISYYYTSTNTINYNTKERFTDDIEGANDVLKAEINAELDKLHIKDINIQTKVFTYIKSILTLLNKYKYIDSPISINNNAEICDLWSNYNNGEYNASLNSCINIPGQSSRSCMSNKNLVSCSKYYNDGRIESLNNVDTNELMNNAKYNIYIGISEINSNVNKANLEMSTMLADYIAKRNLENQQKYFIKYNEYNLEDKKKIINKTNKEFEKTENDVNINKIQFQQTVEQNKINDVKINTYYNYIYNTVIFIVVVGILNFMFSNLE